MGKRLIPFMLWAGIIFLATGCYTKHKVDVAPLEIKPIHITIDVNVRVEKALDDFFGEIDQLEENLDNDDAETNPTEQSP